MKYSPKSLGGCHIKYLLPHKGEITFAMIESQLYHIVNAIYQSYIHQFYTLVFSVKTLFEVQNHMPGKN